LSILNEVILGDVFGFAGGYQSVKRFIRKFRGQQQLEACVVIETAPGEELQVDYGTGPMVRDGHTGKYRRTRLLIGGVPAQLVYSVLAPQFVSEYQIAVLPAARTPTGDAVPIQIQIGGVTTSSQVTIAVVP